MPRKLVAKIQAEADAKHKGDFTKALLTRLAEDYPEAATFLRENTTGKHSKKK